MKSVFSVPWVSEMCVLAMLARSDSYGYEIAKSNNINMGESTIYPILRRLEKTGSLESYSRLSESKLRKFYRITILGQEQLTRAKARWTEQKERLEVLLEGGM